MLNVNLTRSQSTIRMDYLQTKSWRIKLGKKQTNLLQLQDFLRLRLIHHRTKNRMSRVKTS